MIINLNNLSSSEYSIPLGTLNTLTTYYWRVNAIRGNETSNWSSRWAFVTENISGPTLLAPADGSTGTSLTPTLSWNQVNNASSYEVQVSSSSPFSSLIISVANINTTSYNVPNDRLNPQTTYYWRVKCKIGNQTSNWTMRSFKTLALASGPTLLSPSHWSTFEEINPTLDWTDVSGAVSYRLQISRNNSFTDIFYDDSNISQSQFTVPNDLFLYSSYYSWRVYAIFNNNQLTNWSSGWTFRTKPVPTTTLTSPRNRETGQSLTPTLEWSSVSDASHYILELSTSSYFENTLISQNIYSNSYSVPSNLLNYGTTYFWRVRVVARNQQSNWSATFNFTTRRAKESVEDLEITTKSEERYNIEVYPNPTTDVLNIRGSFGKKVNISIMLTDLSGKRLLSFDARKVSDYDDRIYLSGLPGGVYILRFIIDNQEITRQIIKN